MTSPVEKIVVQCPECGKCYEDWWRPSINLQLDDFDDDYLRTGIELMSHAVRQRYLRTMPISIWNNRLFYGYRALMYRLRPKLNVKRLHEQELKSGGYL